MIGIGVGIDYALFIVTRYRQGLDEGLDPEHAVVRAIDTAGRAVVFAGCTVVISLLGLFLMGVDFVNGMAVGTSVTVGDRDAGVDHAAPGAPRLRGPHHRPLLGPPHPGREAARAEPVVPVEPRRAAAPVARVRAAASRSCSCWRSRCCRCGSAFPDAGGNPTSRHHRARPTTSSPTASAQGSTARSILAAEFPKGADTRPLDALVAQLRSTPDVAAVDRADAQPVGRRRRDPGDPGQLAAVGQHDRPRRHAPRRRHPRVGRAAATCRSTSAGSRRRASTCPIAWRHGCRSSSARCWC